MGLLGNLFGKKNRDEDEPTLTATKPITEDDILNRLIVLDQELEQLVLNYKSIDDYNTENNLSSGVPLRNVQSQIDSKTNEINSYLDSVGVDQNFYKDIYYTYRSPTQDSNELIGSPTERLKMLESYLSEGRQLFPTGNFGELNTNDLQELWAESVNRENVFRNDLEYYNQQGNQDAFDTVMDRFKESRDRTDRLESMLDNRDEPYSQIASTMGEQTFHRSQDLNKDYLDFQPEEGVSEPEQGVSTPEPEPEFDLDKANEGIFGDDMGINEPDPEPEPGTLQGEDSATPEDEGIESETSGIDEATGLATGTAAGTAALEAAAALGLGIGGTGGAGAVSGALAGGFGLEPLSEESIPEEGTLGGNQAGGHFTDEQKRESNQRAIDEGRDPPFPEVIAGYKSPQDIANEKLQDQLEQLQEQLANTDPRETYGPSQFGPYDTILNQIRDIQNQLGISGGTKPSTEPSTDQPTEDLEPTSSHHDDTQHDTIQDNTLDFEHIGATRTNFDENFISFILKTILKKSLLNGGLGSKTADILVDNSQTGLNVLYDNIKTGRLNSDYNRLQIEPSDSHPLTSPTLPLVIITIYLYLVDRQSDFKININLLNRPIIKYILTSVLELNQKDSSYALSIIERIPVELQTAYVKQKGEREGSITLNEVSKIDMFIDYVNKEYLKTYGKELKRELFNFENKQSLYLYEMLETLSSSSVLFQISAAFNTIGELITEMIENPYLLVQLFALMYSESEGEDLSASNILNQGKVDKLVYYFSDLKTTLKEPNKKIAVLTDIALPVNKRGLSEDMNIIQNSKKVGLYKSGDRYYVAFRGTDKNDLKDLTTNLLNFGGKDYFDDNMYNERIVIGKRYLEQAIELSRQNQLQPPIVLGYSLGSISAMALATIYPNIEVDVYNPILSRSEVTNNLMSHLEGSNIHFNYNVKDPISTNLKSYSKEYPSLDIREFQNNKFFSPHDIRQFA